VNRFSTTKTKVKLCKTSCFATVGAQLIYNELMLISTSCFATAGAQLIYNQLMLISTIILVSLTRSLCVPS